MEPNGSLQEESVPKTMKEFRSFLEYKISETWSDNEEKIRELTERVKNAIEEMQECGFLGKEETDPIPELCQVKYILKVYKLAIKMARIQNRRERLHPLHLRRIRDINSCEKSYEIVQMIMSILRGVLNNATRRSDQFEN